MSDDVRSQIHTAAGESGSPRRSRTALYATGLVTLAISLIIVLRLMVRPSIDPANRTVVVMPFENLGSPSDAYFVDGVSEEIAGQLSRLPGVKVIGRDGVRGATDATMRPREVATVLGAQYLRSATGAREAGHGRRSVHVGAPPRRRDRRRAHRTATRRR